MIEILLTLYECILNKNDKFILSKSHSSFPMSILLRSKGFKTAMTTHYEIDTKNGIYCTTGSLGHGLPIATGMALARKKQKKGGEIYVLVSDGECQEGTTWESLLISSKHRLDNLNIIVDYNKIQALQRIDDVLPLKNLCKKFKSFNINCYEIKNGHSFENLIKIFKKNVKNCRPTAYIVHTTKGKGIKEFENDPIWHARKIEKKELEIGKKRLGIK